MTEGQRQTLHELLDRMIDEGLEYGVSEYAVLPDDISTVITPDPHIPSIWEFNRTRMELALKIIKEKGVI
jgi:hypothetical protein